MVCGWVVFPSVPEMSCRNVCLVKEGQYTGAVVEGPEYETAAMLGSNLGIGNFSAVLRGNYLCDELEMDTISTGNLIGVIIDGYESGLLSLEDLDGVPLNWGDEAGIMTLIEEYEKILDIYYTKRGWDENGIPKEELEQALTEAAS